MVSALTVSILSEGGQSIIIKSKSPFILSISFLRRNSYIPDPDFYITLLSESEIIEKIVELVVEDNYDNIINGKIENIYDNEIIISFIE